MKGDLSGDQLVWTHVSAPAPEELAGVIREALLTPADAEFVAVDNQRPEVAIRNDYLALLIHVPTFDKQTRITRGVALYFIVREGHLWTVCHEAILDLESLWAKFSTDEEKRTEYFADGPLGLALHIISVLFGGSFRKLNRLAKHIDIAEDAVFQGNERKMVEEISLLMRDVMDFRKVIRLQANIFAKVPAHPLAAGASPAWARVHGQTKKLWDVLEGLYESTTHLSNTNRDLLQHKENALLRLLTVYSIFSIPALVLISPYNRPSPYANRIDMTIYLGIFAAFVVALVAILVRAKRKRVL